MANYSIFYYLSSLVSTAAALARVSLVVVPAVPAAAARPVSVPAAAAAAAAAVAAVAAAAGPGGGVFLVFVKRPPVGPSPVLPEPEVTARVPGDAEPGVADKVVVPVDAELLAEPGGGKGAGYFFKIFANRVQC